MKVLDIAIECIDEFSRLEDLPMEGTRQHLQTANRKADRLEAILEKCLQHIADLRYREWPRGTVEVLGLCPEYLDELLVEGDKALRASRRAK